MLKTSLNKISILLSRITFLAPLFLVPIFFAYFLITNNVFELNKMVLFRLLAVILFFLYAIRLLYDRREQKKIKYFFWQKEILPLVAFFIFLVFTTFHSIDLRTSFFGQEDTIEGLLSFIYYLLFFIVSVSIVKPNQIEPLTSPEKDRDDERGMTWGMKKVFALSAIALSSVLVSAYGLLQASGHDPLHWIESTQGRITSTLGQPNNAGSYFLFVIPITIYLFFYFKSKLAKAFWLLLIFSQLAVLYFTFSISSWLGLFAGLVVTLFIYYFIISNFQFPISNFVHSDKGKLQIKTKIQNPKIIATALFCIISIILIGGLSLPFFRSKINSIIHPSGSSAVRVQLWSASLKAIKEKPWLGYGLESQMNVIGRYYERDWAVYSNVNMQSSRAHNLILDALLTGGIVGLLILLAFLIWIFSLIWRIIKKGDDILFGYAMLWIFSAYFIFQQFNYAHVSVQVYFWVLLAMVFAANQQGRNLKQREDSLREVVKNKTQNRAYDFGIMVARFLLIFVFGWGAFKAINFEIKRLSADHYFWELRKTVPDNEYITALDEYRFIKEVIPNYSPYDQGFAGIMLEWARRINSKPFYTFVNKELIKILPQIKTDNYVDISTRAAVYASLAGEDPKYFAQAEELGKGLIALRPEMPLVYRQYGTLLFFKKDYKQAIEYYNIALSKLPPLNKLQGNKMHENALKQEMSSSYDGLRQVYEKMGDKKRAEEYRKLMEDPR